eukprot:scaffold1231_cov107-Cylindrotheca_fusiformis.AAC.2
MAEPMTLAAAMSSGGGGDDIEGWKFPLMLSFLAGASTCAGAAIVFVFDAKQIERSMTFSLSLAASVMITVSVISIGPECLEDIVAYHETTQQLTIELPQLGERLLSFAIGCCSYWLLSKALAAFPEPETLFFLPSPPSPSPFLEKQHSSESDEERETHHTVKQQQQQLVASSQSSGGYHGNDHRHSKSTTTTTTTSPNVMTQRTAPQQDSSLRRSSSTGSREESTSIGKGTSSSFSTSFDNKAAQQSDFYDSKKSKEETASKKRSWRVAMLLFFSLLFHNFPEGLAVVASTVESRQLGITVAIGILIHNIPEGIAIAVPCIAARPDAPWLAFWLASGSGLAEPLGAVFALSILRTGTLPMENVLACVAGIMCTVSVLELYPEAIRHAPLADSTIATTTTSTMRKDYRSLMYGTLVGTAIMVATESYLP